MSTNHTPNYGLCQWERSDKVLMDDFNADNAKIDAALGDVDRRAGFKLIREAALEEMGTVLSVSLAGIPWEEYGLFIITIDLVLNTMSEFPITFGSAGIGTIQRTGASSPIVSARIFCTPMFYKETRALFCSMGLVEDKVFSLDGKFGQAGFLTLRGYGIEAGSRVQIWGLR